MNGMEMEWKWNGNGMEMEWKWNGNGIKQGRQTGDKVRRTNNMQHK
jgi:hypothetical protein